MANFALTKGKLKKIIDRDGEDCWLCKKPVMNEVENTHPLKRSIDHYVPRKWGGSSKVENLRIAHRLCNSGRESLYPESFLFSTEEMMTLTNLNCDTGGLSKAALRGLNAIHRMKNA